MLTPQQIAENHVLAMYRRLCKGVCIISLALPLILIAYTYACDLPFDKLPGSMSAYYNSPTDFKCSKFFADWGRSFFVGVLFIIGFFLIVFPAFTKFQIILKLSGVLALVIALFRTGTGDWIEVVHGTAAMIFFIPVGIIALFPRFDTVHLIKDEVKRSYLAGRYRLAGRIMALGSLLIAVLAIFLRFSFGWIFWVETVCILGFAVYWWHRADEVLALGFPENPR